MKLLNIVIILFLINFMGSAVNAETYVLGTGDSVRVTVYEHPDLSTTTRVSDNGKVSFPLIGDVMLSGLSARKAEKKIANLLENGGYVRSPQVSVIVENYESRQVSILGNVNRPGKYPIARSNSLIDLIAQAGGISDQAGEKVIIYKKPSGKTQSIDLFNVFLDEKQRKIIEVEDGDMIYVPKMDMFYIYGQVQRPGSYRLEKDMTVMQALAVSGSVTSRGSERGIKIKRKNSQGVIEVIPVEQIEVILPDDVIYVKESLF